MVNQLVNEILQPIQIIFNTNNYSHYIQAARSFLKSEYFGDILLWIRRHVKNDEVIDETYVERLDN